MFMRTLLQGDRPRRVGIDRGTGGRAFPLGSCAYRRRQSARTACGDCLRKRVRGAAPDRAEHDHGTSVPGWSGRKAGTENPSVKSRGRCSVGRPARRRSSFDGHAGLEDIVSGRLAAASEQIRTPPTGDLSGLPVILENSHAVLESIRDALKPPSVNRRQLRQRSVPGTPLRVGSSLHRDDPVKQITELPSIIVSFAAWHHTIPLVIPDASGRSVKN